MTRKADEILALQNRAYAEANRRPRLIRFSPIAFTTKHGLLVLDWSGMHWCPRWLPKPRDLP